MSKKSVRDLAEEELRLMQKQFKPHKTKHLKLYEVDRWNRDAEVWQEVVVLASTRKDAERRVRGTRLRKVEEFQ